MAVNVERKGSLAAGVGLFGALSGHGEYCASALRTGRKIEWRRAHKICDARRGNDEMRVLKYRGGLVQQQWMQSADFKLSGA